ncbi:MAG: glycosyltransferase [Chloroflexi bacterium]|uniref:Glycosyltransferase n=1 Tax=Candidatus Chlorohelix allophototropha TaxID=3003348 RepID=A0A8T7M039_9CHLR|nr:glycosyltransferase [Chloroflexota bacterium]WJW66980.1 glycosyltransferase [Chloroflexota bacterium L227-S17]
MFSSISVIIPVYNGQKFIGDALESALRQSVAPEEIIVVDDGSTDSTAEVVESMRQSEPTIRLIRQPNAGQPVARNRGVNSAHGKFLLMLDADDRLLPNHIEVLHSAARKSGVAFSDYQVIDINSKVQEAHHRLRAAEVRLPNVLAYNYFPIGGSMITRDLWEKIGGLDEKLIGVEDWDWITRALLAGYKPAHVPLPLWQYRFHAQNTSRNPHRMVQSNLARLDKAFGEMNLPIKYHRYRAFSYLVNHALAAGQFLSIGNETEALYHLQQAHLKAPHLFYSLQLFISYLKMYALNGGHDLAEKGVAAVLLATEIAEEEQEKTRLHALGLMSLGLLLAKRPAQALPYLSTVITKHPTVFLEVGNYRTLAHYTRMYATEMARRLYVG